MPRCPVCKSEVGVANQECCICGFTELHGEFVNVEEARSWERAVLRPCRAIWEKANQYKSPEKKLHDNSNLISNGIVTYPCIATCNNCGAPCEIFEIQCENLTSGSTRVRFSAKLKTEKGSSINITCRVKTKDRVILRSEHWSHSIVTSNDIVKGVFLFENVPPGSYLDFV